MLAIHQILALQLKLLGAVVTNRSLYSSCHSVTPIWPAARIRGTSSEIRFVQNTLQYVSCRVFTCVYSLHKFFICQHHDSMLACLYSAYPGLLQLWGSLFHQCMQLNPSLPWIILIQSFCACLPVDTSITSARTSTQAVAVLVRCIVFVISKRCAQ